MDRRDFIRRAAASAAALKLERGAEATHTAGEPLTLSNDQMVWELTPASHGITSNGLRNNLSGKYYALKPAAELRLTFSAATTRIEIPWWRCTFGPDNDATAAAEENGYRTGYQQSGFDDSGWGTCSNLCLYDLSGSAKLPRIQGRPVVAYNGYGWFRTRFALPQDARGEEVFLNLGGYDQTDWNEYWIFVNGVEVGRRSTSGRWRTPANLRLSPNSAGYQALRFGAADNVIAVRTHRYDRHFGGLSDDILDRYQFDSILCDQFVTVGPPYLDVADFEFRAARREQAPSGPAVVVELRNKAAGVSVTLHYELEGPIRRKWAEIRNESSEKKLLLDVEMDSFHIDAATAGGGYGEPLTVADELFCAIEHPSGLNRGYDQKVSLMHFPGKWLSPGQSLRTNSAIVGVSAAGQAHQGFLDYMEAHTLRKKKIVSLYDSLGITAFPNGLSWTLNDSQNLGLMDLLAGFQKKGIHLDYYIPELSLDTTADSDLTQYSFFSFPDGPGEMIDRVNQLGMKFGGYFSMSAGGWSNWRNPKTIPSRIPTPRTLPYATYRHGYHAGGVGNLCVAAEPYFSMLKRAISYHIRENRVRLVKLDDGHYFCNSTEHEHLPGKYSTEESFNRLIDIAKAGREANPDLFVIWYWGAYSPFFALHGDVLFDIRLSMEAASTGDYPAMFFRDAVTQGLDQGAQFARWVPPMNHDSLGVWLANIPWGNFMETERWQEALVMDLARGNLMFPQLWSDLYNLEEHDIEFLARLQRVAKQNEPVLLARRHTIGDAWKDEIYGYSYFDGDHGLVFLNNMSFESRKIKLPLTGSTGLQGARERAVRLRLHHPSEVMLTRNGNPDFLAGQAVEIQLRPFEVMMIEVQRVAGAGSELAARETIETSPIYSYHLPVRAMAARTDLEIPFADAQKFSSQGLPKELLAFETSLPEYSSGRYHAAVVNTFKKDGRWWRQSQMSQFVQAVARVDDRVIEFTRTPDYRQTGNNQWNPWIVFSSPLPRNLAGKPIQLGITSYLPEGVQMTTDLWVIKEWWRPRRRPLPNYWV